MRECLKYLARWDVAYLPSVDFRYGSASDEAAWIDIPDDEAMILVAMLWLRSYVFPLGFVVSRRLLGKIIWREYQNSSPP